MNIFELAWPDLDDIGYEWRREALLEFARTEPVVHWQKPAAAEATAACHGKPGRIQVTRLREFVTCGACQQSRSWQEVNQVPPKPRVPCPSEPAYRRHLRRGEYCRACMDVVAALRRQQRAAKRGAGAMVVTCARCRVTYPENDPDVTYSYGDWWCYDEAACNTRMAALEDTHAI